MQPCHKGDKFCGNAMQKLSVHFTLNSLEIFDVLTFSCVSSIFMQPVREKRPVFLSFIGSFHTFPFFVGLVVWAVADLVWCRACPSLQQLECFYHILDRGCLSLLINLLSWGHRQGFCLFQGMNSWAHQGFCLCSSCLRFVGCFLLYPQI